MNAFRRLPSQDQLAVYEAIAQSQVPEQYGELTDAELEAIAAESFAFLDKEEDATETW